jgi:hypothetical protein
MVNADGIRMKKAQGARGRNRGIQIGPDDTVKRETLKHYYFQSGEAAFHVSAQRLHSAFSFELY